MHLHRAGLVFVAASGWIVVALQMGNAPVAWRTLATFLFAFFAPGLSVVLLLRSRDFVERAVLAIALSLAVDVLVAESLALAHHFTGLLTSVVLAALTTALTGIGAISHHQRALS